MPRFNVLINAVLVGFIDAKNAHDAVDEARAHHIDPLSEVIPVTPPEEGGESVYVVSSDEPWIDSAGKTQPPGVVSSFTERHEPAEHLREAIEAAAREAEEARLAAEERERIKAEVRAEVLAELAAEAAVKGGAK
jgi:hypothetical protein